MNADYINWYPINTMEIKNVILVKERFDTDKKREKEMPLFEKIQFVDEIKNENAREWGTSVYLLTGAKQSINKILEREIKDRKKPVENVILGIERMVRNLKLRAFFY